MFQTKAQCYETTKSMEAVSANPHRLVQMLMERFLDNMTLIKGCMDNQKIEMKSNLINKSLDILTGLRACLNFEEGGNVAEELNQLYDYMIRSLYEANSQNDKAKIELAHHIMSEIKSGWDQIPEEYHYTQSNLGQ